MIISRTISLTAIFILLFTMSACSTAPYTEDSTIRGTIEELITKEKFLFDNRFLLITEPGKDGQNERNYEIPVDSFKDYEVGQQVEIVVFSNLEADLWDLNHMKFEITVIK